ncbi:MAG: hypothetical protein AN487_21810 [Anabaena sp. CRKS33]|jgi:hypothetical protein|nr:MAG: hypothetical protein AN487_21810 [Anabaena sp. CRKS33]
MNKFHKLLIITSVIGSTFGWNIHSTQAQSNLSQSECKNDSSLKTAYGEGWSAGFNSAGYLDKYNNSYQDENRRRCYEIGYSNGLIASAKRDSDESSLYISCLASRLNNPTRVCQQPR